MQPVADLIDRGIRAFAAGRVGEALRAFQDVLAADPGNPKARSYLVLLGAPVAAAPAEAPLPEVDLVGFGPSPWDDGPAAAATFVLEPGGGLDLDAVAESPDPRPPAGDGRSRAAPSRSDVALWMQAARELSALGDYTGALELIEKILQADPAHPEGREHRRHCEATLVSMYESKLGGMSRIPRVAIQPEEVMWLNLDHRAGFLLAQIDGTVDFEALFALSGLPRLETARILAGLIADGVIAA